MSTITTITFDPPEVGALEDAYLDAENPTAVNNDDAWVVRGPVLPCKSLFRASISGVVPKTDVIEAAALKLWIKSTSVFRRDPLSSTIKLLVELIENTGRYPWEASQVTWNSCRTGMAWKDGGGDVVDAYRVESVLPPTGYAGLWTLDGLIDLVRHVQRDDGDGVVDLRVSVLRGDGDDHCDMTGPSQQCADIDLEPNFGVGAVRPSLTITHRAPLPVADPRAIVE